MRVMNFEYVELYCSVDDQNDGIQKIFGIVDLELRYVLEDCSVGVLSISSS